MRSVGLILILLSVLIPILPPILFGEAGFVVFPLAFLTIPGILVGMFMAFDRNGGWFTSRSDRRSRERR
jgi:hypothetical protein